MDLSSILIDLEIIKQLKPDDKLGVNLTMGEKKLYVDTNHILLPLARWYYGQTRENTIKYLNELIIKIENTSNFLVEGKHLNTADTFKNTLNSARDGLDILKKTYQNDSLTSATLTILINRFDCVCEKLKKLNESLNNNDNNNNNNNISEYDITDVSQLCMY